MSILSIIGVIALCGIGMYLSFAGAIIVGSHFGGDGLAGLAVGVHAGVVIVLIEAVLVVMWLGKMLL